MSNDRRAALAALAAAGTLWGTSVPLTKLALEWLPPGWLTVARFGLAAVVLGAAAGFRVGAACSPAVLAWGAAGYGGSILLQNAGLTRTSVSHAALLVGVTPVIIAVIAALRHRRWRARSPGRASRCRWPASGSWPPVGAAARPSPATAWCWRRWSSRPRSRSRSPGCCPAATRSP